MTRIPLPDELEAKIAACEAIVEADTAKIDETLESLDGAPIKFLEDDLSLVHSVESVRITARRSTRVATSHPPPLALAAKAR